jgi:ADP-heptose:LPS heptosyltransferase
MNPARAIVHMLADPGILRWAAPFRTLRQVCGLRPLRISLTQAKRILVMRPDGVGDIVLTSPFLRELRRSAPQAHITLLVPAACHELVRNCPYADQVECLDFHSGGKWRYRLTLIGAAWNLRRNRLRFRGFDLVLLPRRGADWYSAELVGHILAGKGTLMVHRETLVEGSAPTPPDPPVDFEAWSNPCTEHEALHNLRFLRWCGASDAAESRLELWLLPDDKRVAQEVTNRFGGDRSLCAVIPSASAQKKIWPGENLAGVISALCGDFNFNVVIVGGRDAADFGARMEADIPRNVLNTAGQLTMRQSAALLERCQLTIANDSGPMHLAAAARSHVVVISCHPLDGDPWHGNSPCRFGPWDSIHRVLQPVSAMPPCKGFCGHKTSHCIREVSPEQVLGAVKQLLSSGGAQDDALSQ